MAKEAQIRRLTWLTWYPLKRLAISDRARIGWADYLNGGDVVHDYVFQGRDRAK